MDVKWLKGEAWYNTMPGADDKDLHVAGTCWLSSVSTEIRLEPGNPGINPEPGVFVLEMKAETPEVCLDQVDDGRQVDWNEDVGGDIKQVRIIGAAEAVLEVRDVV